MRALTIFSLFIIFTLGAATDAAAMITRRTLGKGVRLGAIYNGRAEQFTGFYAWPKDVTDKFTIETPVRNSELQLSYGDSVADKARLLGISGEFSLSINAGQITCSGSASYLRDYKKTELATKMSIVSSLRTMEQSLDVFHPEMKSSTYTAAVNGDQGTHVVTSVRWGSDCIASFSRLFESEFERVDISASLKIAIQAAAVAVSGSGQGTSNNFDFSQTEDVQVTVVGDLIPPTDERIPVSVEEALDFMRRLHQIGLQGGGVPMEFTMVPLSWVTDATDKLVHNIGEKLVMRASNVMDELISSEAAIRDLLSIPAFGFLAWQRKAAAFLDDFLAYSNTFLGSIAAAVVDVRTSGNKTILSELLTSYDTGDFSKGKVRVHIEELRDAIETLKAEVKMIVLQGKVTMAEHFYQYSAPSLDRKYDKVYALILQGMTPQSTVERTETINRFLNLAQARIRTKAPDPVKDPKDNITHCLEVVGEVATDKICSEVYKFIVIHFDSFCTNFCPAQFCGSNPPTTCNETDKSEFSECFCMNPETKVVLYDNSMGPAEGDMPAMPPKPVIEEITGATNSSNIEPSPFNQRVELDLQDPGMRILNYKVRVLWYIAIVSDSGDVTWQRRQRTFETRDNSTSIGVTGLVSGQEYQFQVSAVTPVGQSPFCSEFPEYPVLVSQNTVVVSLQSKPLTSVASLPNFKNLNITISVSLTLDESIYKVVINSTDSDVALDCDLLDGQTNNSQANCTLKSTTKSMSDEACDILVFTRSSGDAPVAVTVQKMLFVAPSTEACKTWGGSATKFCNISGANYTDCVADCTSCKLGSITTSETNGVCNPVAPPTPTWKRLATGVGYTKTDKEIPILLNSGTFTAIRIEFVNGYFYQPLERIEMVPLGIFGIKIPQLRRYGCDSPTLGFNLNVASPDGCRVTSSDTYYLGLRYRTSGAGDYLVAQNNVQQQCNLANRLKPECRIAPVTLGTSSSLILTLTPNVARPILSNGFLGQITVNIDGYGV